MLGSFLHNLRVPFSGNILTAIGIVILISLSHLWRENGLFWRAGLVCAVMKTMSPSAIIFGPMIAILAESVLLESSVRIFGRTIPGFIIGSMLAMSWNLFQKVFNLIIFYGGNMVEIYTNITSWAAKQLNLSIDAFWAPLVVLLVLYALFGAAAAVAGIRTGRRMVRMPKEKMVEQPIAQVTNDRRSQKPFNYSVAWLVSDVIIVAGLLWIVSRATWPYWLMTVIPAAVLLSWRYKRVMRQLLKPGFWTFFILITILSALAFTSLQNNGKTLAEGLLIGIQMNFRAVIIIVGFSALGTELYNPRIRALFIRSRFRQLPLAIELSAASLPYLIGMMPDFKTAFRDPAVILKSMVDRVEARLHNDNIPVGTARNVIIITGQTGEGKTGFIEMLIKSLQNRGIRVGGIMAPRIMEEEVTTGYDIVDLGTGTRVPFLRHINRQIKHGFERFTIMGEGYQTGLNALDPDRNVNSSLVVVDEIGPMELKGKGWDKRMAELLEKFKGLLIIVVRNRLVEEVQSRYGIGDPVVYDIGTSDVTAALEEITERTRAIAVNGSDN